MTTLWRMMLAAVLMALLLASPAQAQGKWSGCYIGGNVGMAGMDTKADVVATPTTIATIDGLGGSGQMYGGSFGCDLKIDKLVIGAFGGGNWFQDTNFTLSVPVLGGASVSTGLDWEWSAGARLGYLLSERTLAYGLAAYTQLHMEDIKAAGFGGSVAFGVPKLTGWQIGGGIEHQLDGNLSLKAEYRYSFYDAQTAAIVPGLNVNFEPTVQTVTLGLAYKFDLFGK